MYSVQQIPSGEFSKTWAGKYLLTQEVPNSATLDTAGTRPSPTMAIAQFAAEAGTPREADVGLANCHR
jgi:hypothetical protein